MRTYLHNASLCIQSDIHIQMYLQHRNMYPRFDRVKVHTGFELREGNTGVKTVILHFEYNREVRFVAGYKIAVGFKEH